MDPLDHAILTMERRWYRHQGAKAEAVRAELGMSLTQYLQRLRWISEQPEALQADPVLVNRLRRRWR